jgi:hypothetical protein
MPNLNTLLNGGDAASLSSAFLDGTEKETTLPACDGVRMHDTHRFLLRWSEHCKHGQSQHGVFQGHGSVQVLAHQQLPPC